MQFAALLSGFGLAGSAGLNAYVPLLLVALLARFHVIALASPFDVLAHTWAIVVLAVLLLIEFVVDKIPAVDHANDVVQTFVRPAAGALLFASASGVVKEIPASVLLTAGLLTALSVHATKAAARPVVNTATIGFGAPVVSFVEDIASVALSLLSLFAPFLVLVGLLLLAWFAWWVYSRRRRARAAQASSGA